MYNQKEFMSDLEMRNIGEPEFIQAVSEVLESVIDVVNNDPEYLDARILERITEPDRVFMFKVEWDNDDAEVQVYKGY
jgi:glutamate dehydrogenase (NADP+)